MFSRTLCLAPPVALLVLASGAAGQTEVVPPSAELFPEPAVGFDEFGIALALDGERMLVGARGAEQNEFAYVFAHRDGNWIQEARVGGSAFSEFGLAVALSGEHFAVGAPMECGPGRCDVYRRVGDVWELDAVLTQPVGGFGYALALDGDTLLVGACSFFAPVTRAVFVYVRGRAGWTLQAVLQPSSPFPFLYFGDQLALDGDTAVVGGYLGTSTSVRAALFVFQREGEKWRQTAHLTHGGANGPSFLVDLDLDGDELVTSLATPTGSGLFVSERKGAGWGALGRIPVTLAGRVHKLFPECSLALAGGTLVTGTFPDLGSGETPRRSMVLERVDRGWSPAVVLGPPEGESDDGFGLSVAVDRDRVAVGAPWRSHRGVQSGAVYVYELAPARAAAVPVGPRSSRSP